MLRLRIGSYTKFLHWSLTASHHGEQYEHKSVGLCGVGQGRRESVEKKMTSWKKSVGKVKSKKNFVSHQKKIQKYIKNALYRRLFSLPFQKSFQNNHGSYRIITIALGKIAQTIPCLDGRIGFILYMERNIGKCNNQTTTERVIWWLQMTREASTSNNKRIDAMYCNDLWNRRVHHLIIVYISSKEDNLVIMCVCSSDMFFAPIKREEWRHTEIIGWKILLTD